MFRNLMLSAVAAATLGVAAIGTSSAASAHDWYGGGARVPDTYDLSRPHHVWRERPVVVEERVVVERPAYPYAYGWRRPVYAGYGYGHGFYGRHFYRGW